MEKKHSTRFTQEAFLINAEDDGVVRRVHLEANHLEQFFLKAGIRAKVKRAQTVGMKIVLLENEVDDRGGIAHLPRQRAHVGPIRLAWWWRAPVVPRPIDPFS
jgi:hypothetical protein